MTNAMINAAIRDEIARNGAKLVSVEAVSKTGEIKTFVFSDAARQTHLAGIVTASGKQAAETRERNNPDLFNVWDIRKGAWRSFDLNNVLTVKAQGRQRVFRFHRPRVYA